MTEALRQPLAYLKNTLTPFSPLRLSCQLGRRPARGARLGVPDQGHPPVRTPECDQKTAPSLRCKPWKPTLPHRSNENFSLRGTKLQYEPYPNHFSRSEARRPGQNSRRAVGKPLATDGAWGGPDTHREGRIGVYFG